MITAKDILKYKGSEIVSVDKNTPVVEAIKLMIDQRIGALTVTDKKTIVGIWTERDLLRNIAAPGFELNKATLEKAMLSTLHKMPHSATLPELEGAFLGLYTRYLYITKGEKIIGMISTGDVMKAHMNKQKEEMERLKSYVSMEYYENWRWDPKKK